LGADELLLVSATSLLPRILSSVLDCCTHSDWLKTEKKIETTSCFHSIAANSSTGTRKLKLTLVKLDTEFQDLRRFGFIFPESFAFLHDIRFERTGEMCQLLLNLCKVCLDSVNF